VELSDHQARKLGAILGGAFSKPAVVEEVEAVFDDLLIDLGGPRAQLAWR
jgi:hypothetical protein